VLADGTRFEAGLVTSDSIAPKEWDAVDFGERPSVLHQVQTFNGPSFVVTRQRATDADGMDPALQEEEALASTGHADEEIGWLAMERGAGDADGADFRAGSVGGIDQRWHTIDLGLDNATSPEFLASLATTRGADTAGLRFDGIDGGAAVGRVAEEWTRDDETGHVGEVVDFLALEGAGQMRGIEYDAVV
jgi:hypothetical protein